jgi:hypothetical protein
MAGLSSLVIKIGADTAQAVSAIKNVDGALDKTASSGQKLQAGIQKAAIPAAAALTALGAAAMTSVQAAAAAQKSREQLDSQLERSTGATQAVVTANEEWISSMSKATATSAGELRPAMADLVRSTDSVWQSQQLLTLALDTAAATGKPLTSVTAALGKAYQGQYGALQRLVPSITATVKAGGSFAEVQKELNKQVEGAAKGEAGTAAGQYKQMELSMKALQVQIGTALLPVFQQLIPVVTQAVGVMSGHTDVIIGLGAAVAVFSGAILAANAAISVYNTLTTIQRALDQSANIQKLIAAARTVAYTAAMVAQRVVMVAISAATKAWTIAQIALNIALSANPVGLVVVAVVALTAAIILAYRHSATFRNIVQEAFRVARDNIVLLLGPMGLIIKAMIELYQHSATVRTIVTGTFNAILDAINAVVRAIQDLVGKLGSIHFPSKPSWLPLSAPGSYATPYAIPTAAAGGGTVVNVTVQAIDPESAAIAVRRVLSRYDRRRGNRVLGGQGDYA